MYHDMASGMENSRLICLLSLSKQFDHLIAGFGVLEG